MQLVDYSFYFKNTIRFVLMHKIGYISNTYDIPYIKKLLFFFSINRLEDIDDVQGYIIFICLSFFLDAVLF